MIRLRPLLAACLFSSAIVHADVPRARSSVPSPTEIVAAAPASDWVRIAPADLLVMDLAADTTGKSRRIVIQLMPAPFSQGWIDNIRKLVAARWYNGNAIVRVQDNYVVQWGDPAGEGESADGRPHGVPKRLPAGLTKVPQSDYTAYLPDPGVIQAMRRIRPTATRDAYSDGVIFYKGWPVGVGIANNRLDPAVNPAPAPPRSRDEVWPIHCYGTVGVGRDMPPDTGSGAELYAVIGQPPRQLDRNIAVVGRVIDGIELLSSLPRGSGPMGFYKNAPERVTILLAQTGDKVPGLPAYEYLSTESASFARYAEARANRRDAFFVRPAGGADICNVSVPIRPVP